MHTNTHWPFSNQPFFIPLCLPPHTAVHVIGCWLCLCEWDTERVKQEKRETGNQIEGLSGSVYQWYLGCVCVRMCVSELIASCVFLTIAATLIAEVPPNMILMTIKFTVGREAPCISIRHISLILWCPDQTSHWCQTYCFSLCRFWPVFALPCSVLNTEKWRVRQAARPTMQPAKPTDALIQDGPLRASMDPQLLGAKAGFTDTVSLVLARDIYTICLHATQRSPVFALLLSLLTHAMWWACSLQHRQWKHFSEKGSSQWELNPQPALLP